MSNFIKIDFSKVSYFLLEDSPDEADDFFDEFDILEHEEQYDLDEFDTDSFISWLEANFGVDNVNQIEDLINRKEFPLEIVLYCTLFKSISNNVKEIDLNPDKSFNLGSCYSITILNSENFDKSFRIDDNSLLITKEDWSTLSDYIEENLPSLEEQIQIFNSLNVFTHTVGENECIFISKIQQDELEQEDLSSKLKFYLLIVRGETIHTPVTVNNINYPELLIPLQKSNIDYKQFDEIADLLSQYNSENRLLSKFLILYQILENFEIKHDVVKEMGRASVFKVRDFTRLVNNSQLNEEKYLKKLLDELFNLIYDEVGNTGQRIVDLVDSSYNFAINSGAFQTSANSRLENQLKQIGFENANVSSFMTNVKNKNTTEIVTFLTKSIYKIRCSVVHYKTHEFHLSDVHLHTMSELKLFLESFLVPFLYKLISVSIFSFNSPVVYRRNTLTLF